MNYSASESCSECGKSHTTSQATQARADSIARQLARTCAGNDQRQAIYDASAARRAAELEARKEAERQRKADRKKK